VEKPSAKPWIDSIMSHDIRLESAMPFQSRQRSCPASARRIPSQASKKVEAQVWSKKLAYDSSRLSYSIPEVGDSCRSIPDDRGQSEQCSIFYDESRHCQIGEVPNWGQAVEEREGGGSCRRPFESAIVVSYRRQIRRTKIGRPNHRRGFPPSRKKFR